MITGEMIIGGMIIGIGIGVIGIGMKGGMMIGGTRSLFFFLSVLFVAVFEGGGVVLWCYTD